MDRPDGSPSIVATYQMLPVNRASEWGEVQCSIALIEI